MCTYNNSFVFLLSLSKSIKNEACYIDYRVKMNLPSEHKLHEKAIIMDPLTFSKNEMPISKSHVVVVNAFRDAGLVNFPQESTHIWDVVKITEQKKDMYRGCHVQCIDEKAISVMIQSIKNKYETIYIMGTANLYTRLTQIRPIDQIIIQVFDHNIEQLESSATLKALATSQSKIDESLEIFTPYTFLSSYTLNMFTKQEHMTLLYYNKINQKNGNNEKNNKNNKNNKNEKQYLDLLDEIVSQGKERPDRTGVGTIGLFARQLRFDLTTSIPLLTTKKMAWKSIIKELLWFLSGDTNSKTLEKQNVHIWRGNTTRPFLDQRGLHHYQEGDIGPLYPFSFRHFGAPYDGCDKDYTHKGFDQWKHLLEGLRNDPFSRRHLITTFNPTVISQCVLPPCHGIAIQFYVEEGNTLENKRDIYDQHEPYGLRCHVYCRSSDSFLGLPFNIASYSILTYIVATLCDMKPLELILSTGDTHIYKNHLDQVQEQLQRTPLPSPKLRIKNTIKEKHISDVSLSDFELIGYFAHPSIKAEMAI